MATHVGDLADGRDRVGAHGLVPGHGERREQRELAEGRVVLAVGRQEAEELGVDHAEHHHHHALLGPLLELALELRLLAQAAAVVGDALARRAHDEHDDREHVGEDGQRDEGPEEGVLSVVLDLAEDGRRHVQTKVHAR